MTSWLSGGTAHHGPMTYSVDQADQVQAIQRVESKIEDAVIAPDTFESRLAEVSQELKDETHYKDSQIIVDLVKWKIKQTEVSCSQKFYYLQVTQSL